MGNSEGSGTPEWLEKLDKQDKERKKDMEENPKDYIETEHGKVHKDKVKPKETVVPHTPERNKKKKPKWAYTLKHGGKKHFIDMPRTEEQIEKVKKQLKNPRKWRRYHKHPYGGNVNYTQINCFPPFDYIRVAEVFLPNGEVWSSKDRRFHKKENYEN